MPDLILYVALKEELDVLSKFFGLKLNVGDPRAEGKINGYPVAVLCPETMGRVPAAVEVTRYLSGRRESKPKLIIVAGVAGGIAENGTTVGHIIVGTTVVDLASRKVKEDADGKANVQFRRRDYNLNEVLWRLLSSNEFPTKDWQEAAIWKADWPQDRRPSLHDGPVASVDEVTSNNELRKQFLESNPKLLAIEMEAGGVCAAADRFGVPVSMLRAVSDNADPSKADDAWRRRGMLTIAEVLARVEFKLLFQEIASR